MAKYIIKGVLLGLVFILINIHYAHSQSNISGPTCVTPGIEYHYNIEGVQDSSSVQVCIQGGVILDEPDSCITEYSLTVLRVIWNEGMSGLITVSSSTSTQNLEVGIIRSLFPGEIDSLSLEQMVDQGSMPDTIKCSQAMNGNCLPNYFYQWQRSTNQVNWDDIPEANGINLKINEPVVEAIYYRRKATETNSGNVNYSNIASVYIIPIPD